MTTVTLEFDNVAYDNFVKEVGKENIFQTFKDFVENYPLYKNALKDGLAHYRLGGCTPFHVPDDFDNDEFPEFYENLDKFADKSASNTKEMQLMPKENRPYRLGALPNIKVPDNFDDIEVTDFDI